jgi:hypothetical protein
MGFVPTGHRPIKSRHFYQPGDNKLCLPYTCCNFAHAQTLYRIGSLCRSRNIWILYGSTLNSLMDTRKSKSDVFQTAISIKHRILATFNIRKINVSDCMPLTVNNTLFLQLFWSLINLLIYLFILILLAAVH